MKKSAVIRSPLLKLALALQRPFIARRETKIYAVLTPDEDGYPPYANEGLWAERLGWDVYELRSIPFFAHGLAWGDIVLASSRNEQLYVASVLEKSGNGTVRVLVPSGAEADRASTQELFVRFRCDWEWKDANLASVCIQSPETYALLVEELANLEKAGHLSYEVGLEPQHRGSTNAN